MDSPTCRQCGLVMSIVRVSEICGRCLTERILNREWGERQVARYFKRRQRKLRESQ